MNKICSECGRPLPPLRNPAILRARKYATMLRNRRQAYKTEGRCRGATNTGQRCKKVLWYPWQKESGLCHHHAPRFG